MHLYRNSKDSAHLAAMPFSKYSCKDHPGSTLSIVGACSGFETNEHPIVLRQTKFKSIKRRNELHLRHMGLNFKESNNNHNTLARASYRSRLRN